MADAEVDRTLDIMRRQRATYEDVARAAASDDVVRVDFVGSIDGTPFEGGSATDFAFTVGPGTDAAGVRGGGRGHDAPARASPLP